MPWLDIIILVIIAISLAWGFYRGLIAQVGAIGGVVLGVVAARLLAPAVAAKLTSITADPDPTGYLNVALAYALVFVVVFLGVKLLAKLTKSITHALCLGVVDRLCGAAFTMFEWLLGLSIVLNLWNVLRPESPLIHASRLAGGRAVEVILQIAPKLLGFALDYSSNS